jgi:SAM-dependent methyltransferase
MTQPSSTLYDHPGFYGLLFDGRRHDIGFYLDWAEEATGPTLELGVGTGRVALALARAGHEVVGVDTSGEMLAELAVRVSVEPPDVRARLSWCLGDARTIDLGRRFGLVVCPFNGLAHHLTDADLDAVLENVAMHLEPSGLFAFDVLAPDPSMLRGDGAYVPWFRDPRTGEVSRCEQTVSFDASSRVLTVTMSVRAMESSRDPEELTLRIRLFAEMEALLERHGFRVVRTERGLGDAVGFVCVSGRAAGR